MECKPKVCFHKEWEFATFMMELKKTHKVEVKVKSICTKRINKNIFENVDMVHEWNRKKHIYIIHHGLNFKGVTVILLIWYFVNGNGNYIKVTNFQVMNFVTSWGYNSLIWTLIQKLWKTKLWSLKRTF